MTRHQFTLFLTENNTVIEGIRAKYNPEQYKLISAHVTLCREDEIVPLRLVIDNVSSLHLL
ncbi:hypothetical protein [Pontibacter korlensis]|nr:hypothetical protein [Pontibacter korlensis]